MLNIIKYTAVHLVLALTFQHTIFAQIILVGSDPCGDAPVSFVDLTPNATAKQSSIDGSSIAGHVIDGDHSEMSLAQTQNDGNAWIEIELEKPSYVEELTIWYPQNQPLGNAYILLSNIPFESENLAQELVLPEVEYLYLQNLQSGSAIPIQMAGVQHIRIQNEGSGVLSLFEVDIPGHVEDCDNGVDDDCDGLVDCDDPDCRPRILNVDLSNGPSCPACSDGSIFIQASSLGLEYSIDGGLNFRPSNTFENLPVGTYTIVVRSGNGCLSSEEEGFLPPLLFGDPNGCCDNGDFESGNFDNWTGGLGLSNAGNPQFNGNTDIQTNFGFNSRHLMISPNSGYEDPRVPDLPVLGTNNSEFVVRLGSNEGGGRAEKLTFIFTVTECNTEFRFNYLMVGNDPHDQHPEDQNGYFKYTLTHVSTGDEISQVTIDINSGGTDPLFNKIKLSDNDIAYTSWECVLIDLSAYVDEEISIEFLTADCDDSAHFCYTYLDGLCDQLEDVVPTVNMELPAIFCQNQPEFLIDASGSLGYSVHGWTVCELDDQNEPINCVTYDELSKGILGLFDVKKYYGADDFVCDKTYRVTLTLGNDCTEEVEDSVEFMFTCEDSPILNYKDIVNCRSDDIDLKIEGEVLCSNCDYTWTPGIIYLNDASAQFPILEGTRNPEAFSTNYNVVAINEFGCIATDDVIVYNYDEFIIDLEAIPEGFCEYELFATITATGSMAPNIIESVVFTNLTQGESFDGVLVETGIDYWIYKLEGFSVARTEGSNEDWKVEAFLNDDLYSLTDNCLLEDFLDEILANDLYHGKVNFIMPNVFTPNDDTVNDFFGPLPCIPVEEQAEKQLNAYYGRLRIWDRWGEKVYEQEISGSPFQPFLASSLAWDGTYNGEPAAQDVYIYSIELKNCDSPNGEKSNCQSWCEGSFNTGTGWFSDECDEDSDCNGESCPNPDDNNFHPCICFCCEWDGDVTLIR